MVTAWRCIWEGSSSWAQTCYHNPQDNSTLNCTNVNIVTECAHWSQSHMIRLLLYNFIVTEFKSTNSHSWPCVDWNNNLKPILNISLITLTRRGLLRMKEHKAHQLYRFINTPLQKVPNRTGLFFLKNIEWNQKPSRTSQETVWQLSSHYGSNLKSYF